MATTSKGASKLDQRAKTALIATAAVLLLTVGWIIYYATSLSGGPKGTPPASTTEATALQEKHQQELDRINQEAAEGRGGKPAPEPRGS